MQTHRLNGAHTAPFLFGRPLRGEAMPVQETTQDVPFWWLIVSCLVSALAGEMWRASDLPMPWSQILKRIALRYAASGLAGVAFMLIALSHVSSQMAFAIGILSSLAGADLALAVYNAWLRKRLGIETAQPTPQASQADNGQL